MTDFPPFDPTAGESPTSHIAVFPDVAALLAEDAAEHSEADEYRVARVPETPVFVLYGIVESRKTVRVVSIRTHVEGRN